MSGSRNRGTSLGIALALALVGAAVVVGVDGVPSPLVSTAKPAPLTSHTGEWIQPNGSNGFVTEAGSLCMVASLPPQPKWMSSPSEALQYYLRTAEPQWPTDGWSVRPEVPGLDPHVRVYEHPSFPNLSVLESDKGLWAVFDIPDCLPTPKS